MSDGEHLDRLARRITWLDRYRRALAIVLAAILTALALWWLSGWLPPNWPGAHLAMVGVMFATVGWYGIETALGFVLALWETDHANLTGPAALPRAQLRRRKRIAHRK